MGRATLELSNPAQVTYIDEVEVGRPVKPRLPVAFEVRDAGGTTNRLVEAGLTSWRLRSGLRGRLKDDSGDFTSIIANSTTRGRASVTITSSTEPSRRAGCTPWIRQ